MKKLLIVVDYQKDFVTGSLGFQQAISLEDGIAEKIAKYRHNDDDIAFTMDTHTDCYLDTQEGKNLPVAHCIEGEAGWSLHGRIASCKADTDLVFKKNTFGSADLFDYLRGTPYSSIELVGIVTNICVISNAILAKTAQPETPIIIDAALCAGFDETLHQKALDVLAGLQFRIIGG